jgi:hypothetical protein
MEGNAALWLQQYKLQHPIISWSSLMDDIEAKFGATDHMQFMKKWLALKQTTTVADYKQQFDTLMYQACMHNPHYDEPLFVSQFVKGLKPELRGLVEAQLPEIVDRAALLAEVHQDILARANPWTQRVVRGIAPVARAEREEGPRAATPGSTWELWKDRQLRDYRRLHNLCFKCGEKYDPTHQCQRRPPQQLHAIVTKDMNTELSDAVLEELEMQDAATAELLHLSLHAMAGTEAAKKIRIRALVGNQVMLILVDSGSSTSSVCEDFARRVGCSLTAAPAARVKIADGSFMTSNQQVQQLEWWA